MKNKQFILLFFTNLFVFLGSNTFGILPAYLESLGISHAVIAFFTNIPNVMLVLLVVIQLKWGINLPRKNSLIVGFICFIAAMGGMSFFRDSIVLMFFCYLFTGVTYAFGFTLLMSLFYDITPPEIRRSRAALFGISGLLSGGLGALIGQNSYLNLPLGYLFLWPGLSAVIGLILSCFIKEQSASGYARERINMNSFFSTPRIKSYIFLALLFGGSLGTYKSFLPLISRSRLGEVDITRFFVLFSAAGVFYRLVSSRLMDRMKRRDLLLFAYGMIFLSILYLQFFTQFFELGIIGIFYGLGHSILFPVLSVSFVELAGENRTIFNNIFLALFTAGNILFPPLLGILGDLFGLLIIPLTLNFFLLLGLFVSFRVTRDE